VTTLAFEAERWYADKGRRVLAVEPLDALAELEVVRIAFADGGSVLYSLVPDVVAWEALLERADGRFRFSGERPGGQVYRLPVDQSHSSWRVGDAHVKCYRRLSPGTHPEVELLRALSERNFAHAPAYLGVLEWQSSDVGTVAVAVVEEFLEGADEGWEWAAGLAAAGDASFAAELGSLARGLHEALAAAFPTRRASAADADGWRRAADAQLTRAIEIEPSIAADEPRVRRELERLDSGDSTLTRVHGDLHVGQFLRTPERIVIVDLEGQPAKTVENRRALDTPLRDLASLARSLDHCGRYAVVRRGADPRRTEEWIAEARARLVDGYGACDRSLLRALEWERALYEFTYAATYLPEWIYAPRAGFEALLHEPES